jgi:hypothetical protein
MAKQAVSLLFEKTKSYIDGEAYIKKCSNLTTPMRAHIVLSSIPFGLILYNELDTDQLRPYLLTAPASEVFLRTVLLKSSYPSVSEYVFPFYSLSKVSTRVFALLYADSVIRSIVRGTRNF